MKTSRALANLLVINGITPTGDRKTDCKLLRELPTLKVSIKENMEKELNKRTGNTT